MKHIRISFLMAIACSVLLTHCDKKLDLSPQQSIDAETAIANEEDVNSAIVGAYSILASGSLYGTDLLLLPDIQAASPALGTSNPDRYATWAGTFQSFRQVYNKNMTRDNAEASRLWIAGYRAINMANLVLENLEKVTDADSKKQYEGEALMIRGILHFELVRFYALPWGATSANSQPGVVIKTQATRTEEQASQTQARSTVAQVYSQAIADLTKAVSLLPEQNGTRATKFTALAFLSRVYLQKADYPNALAAANAVIESGYYELNASVSAAFTNKNTSESIFEIQQNDQNNAGTSNDGMATFYASRPGIGRADIRIASGFVNSYPANDRRKTEWYYTGTGARPGNIYTSKWNSFSQNLPVIRLAEMYLTRAEANIRLNSAVGATPGADLAMVKNAVRTGTISPANPTLAEILNERRLELAFEGVRIHDIKRLRQSVTVNIGGSPVTLAWDSNLLVFPIPQREVDASQGIIAQNPGY